MLNETKPRQDMVRPLDGSLIPHGARARRRKSLVECAAAACAVLIDAHSRNLNCYQQAQRVASYRLLCSPTSAISIGLGTGTVVGAEESDVLDSGSHRSRSRGMFLTGHFTLPLSGRALVGSCVINVGIAAIQFAIVQDQDATNVNTHSVAGSRSQ